MGLEGRVGLITGAAGGLGRVVARELAAAGASVALVGSTAGRLEALARELALPTERYLVHAVDLRVAGDAAAMVAAVLGQLGRIDVWVHAVGGWRGGRMVADTDPDDLAAMLDQHLWTTFHVAGALVPHLVRAGWGRVVAVSAPSAVSPGARSGPYAVAKAAQEALLMTLARETAGTGVTVNVIQVKSIDLEQAPRRGRPGGGATAGPPKPSGTAPEEIAATIRFLCSDEAHVINGARIPLYGGG